LAKNISNDMTNRDDELLETRFSRHTSAGDISRIEAQAGAELRRDLDEGRQVRDAFAYGEAGRLKQLLRDEEKDLGSTGNFSVWVRRAMAAAAVLLPLIWYFGGSTDPYDAAFSTYENNLAAMGAATDLEQKVAAASAAYDQKDYPTAATRLGQLAAEYPDQPRFAFYQANALMAAKRYTDAVPVLEQLVRDNQPPYSIEAQWYLGLAQWKLGKKNEALSALKGYENAPSGQFKTKLPAVLKAVRDL
jgi:predicted Zn-dependent protease